MRTPDTAGRHGTERYLYPLAGIAAAILVFAGFARTFYLRGFFATPALSDLMWLHGTLNTLWLGLFIVQVTLIANRRPDLHRRVGLFAGFLILAMIVTNVAMAIDAGRRGASPAPGITPLMFMAVPLVDVVLFTGLVGTGLWNRKRRDVHKRLMLIATLSLMTPGIARIPVASFHAVGLPAFFGITITAIIICAVIDTIIHHRLHPAFAWGGGLVILSVPFRIFLANTGAWARFASWLIA